MSRCLKSWRPLPRPWAREQVLEKLEAAAETMGADAIVGMRMMTSDLGQNMAEVYMYGTAVKLK